MTKVYAYHALSTWSHANPAANPPRGIPTGKTAQQDIAALAVKAKEKGCDGVILWNRFGFDLNGDMNLDGVMACHNHTSPQVRAWASQTEQTRAYITLEDAGLDCIEYFPCVPQSWQPLTTNEIAKRTDQCFSAVYYYKTLTGRKPRVCIDNSGGKGATSADWIVRETLRRRGIEVGCEPTAHVGTPWVNPDGFSVISGSLWNHRAGWYPSPVPHVEHVLCVGECDTLEFARMQYRRGAVPCITLDKPWNADDVRSGVMP